MYPDNASVDTGVQLPASEKVRESTSKGATQSLPSFKDGDSWNLVTSEWPHAKRTALFVAILPQYYW